MGKKALSAERESDGPDAVRERHEKLLVRAMRNQWRSWARAVEAGTNLVEKHAHLFLAGSRSARKNLAISFFERDRLRELAELSDDGVRDRIGPWMEVALDFAAEEMSVSGPKVAAFFKDLAQAPYIVVLPDWGSPFIQPFPDHRVLYGDLYEITCGGCASAPSRIDLFKSTGGAFSSRERRSAWAGMREDFMSSALEADDAEGPQIMLVDWEDNEFCVSAVGEPRLE